MHAPHNEHPASLVHGPTGGKGGGGGGVAATLPLAPNPSLLHTTKNAVIVAIIVPSILKNVYASQSYAVSLFTPIQIG